MSKYFGVRASSGEISVFPYNNDDYEEAKHRWPQVSSMLEAESEGQALQKVIDMWNLSDRNPMPLSEKDWIELLKITQIQDVFGLLGVQGELEKFKRTSFAAKFYTPEGDSLILLKGSGKEGLDDYFAITESSGEYRAEGLEGGE